VAQSARLFERAPADGWIAALRCTDLVALADGVIGQLTRENQSVQTQVAGNFDELIQYLGRVGSFGFALAPTGRSEQTGRLARAAARAQLNSPGGGLHVAGAQGAHSSDTAQKEWRKKQQSIQRQQLTVVIQLAAGLWLEPASSARAGLLLSSAHRVHVFASLASRWKRSMVTAQKQKSSVESIEFEAV
jgi:hypothetical protein